MRISNFFLNLLCLLLIVFLVYFIYEHGKIKNQYHFLIQKQETYQEISNYVLQNPKSSIINKFEKKFYIINNDSIIILKNKKIENDFYGFEIIYDKNNSVKSIFLLKP